MINQLITTFQGFFTRAFWFGNFLPVALFGVIHVVIAWLAYGSETVPLQTLLVGETSKFVVMFPAIFAGLIVLGYILGPMIPLFRELLDGSLFPESLNEAMRRRRKPTLDAIRDRAEFAERVLGTCRAILDSKYKSLSEARSAGAAINGGGAMTRPWLVARVERALVSLKTTLASGQLPPAEDVSSAEDEIVEAFEYNDATVSTGPNAERAQRLTRAMYDFFRVIKDCEQESSYRLFAINTRHSRVAFRNPQATPMADARFLSESYCLNAYNVDFSYIWPRLQIVLPDQGAQGNTGSYNDRLIGARSQVDFAILSTVLAISVPLVWLPLLFSRGNPISLFIAIGLAAPVLIAFFYQLAVESQFELGEVVKSAIDKYRFSVLTDMHLALPPTLQSERSLWEELRVVEQLPGSTDFYYRHPAAAGGQH
jgi:hypothetical protein